MKNEPRVEGHDNQDAMKVDNEQQPPKDGVPVSDHNAAAGASSPPTQTTNDAADGSEPGPKGSKDARSDAPAESGTTADGPAPEEPRSAKSKARAPKPPKLNYTDLVSLKMPPLKPLIEKGVLFGGTPPPAPEEATNDTQQAAPSPSPPPPPPPPAFVFTAAVPVGLGGDLILPAIGSPPAAASPLDFLKGGNRAHHHGVVAPTQTSMAIDHVPSGLRWTVERSESGVGWTVCLRAAVTEVGSSGWCMQHFYLHPVLTPAPSCADGSNAHSEEHTENEKSNHQGQFAADDHQEREASDARDKKPSEEDGDGEQQESGADAPPQEKPPIRIRGQPNPAAVSTSEQRLKQYRQFVIQSKKPMNYHPAASSSGSATKTSTASGAASKLGYVLRPMGLDQYLVCLRPQVQEGEPEDGLAASGTPREAAAGTPQSAEKSRSSQRDGGRATLSVRSIEGLRKAALAKQKEQDEPQEDTPRACQQGAATDGTAGARPAPPPPSSAAAFPPECIFHVAKLSANGDRGTAASTSPRQQ